MSTSGIKVLTIGQKFDLPYDVCHVDNLKTLISTIAQFHPDVVVTSNVIPGMLSNYAFEIRKRWIHVNPASPKEAIIQAIENCYIYNLYNVHHLSNTQPLISVYTGTWNTGDYLRETYQSLLDQTYPNWEWVVVDDNSTDGTWEKLEGYAKEDIRVRPYRSGKRIGKVGGVKHLATLLCNGVYLVELDHDDQLTDFALAEIRKAFDENPDVGFVYSNCANYFENGTFHEFGDPFWKVRYRDTEYHGKIWRECVNPDVYDRFGPHFTQQFGWFLTVGPNHVRAYRATTFKEVGGYNPGLPVADDWDLYARVFLQWPKWKCLWIDKMLYLYRFLDAWGNTTFTKNKSIQDHLAHGRNHRARDFEILNQKRLEYAAATPKQTNTDKLAFVVASKSNETAKSIQEQLKSYDIFVCTGATSIFDAYEQGRIHWQGRRRIVYVHDDVQFKDAASFVQVASNLPEGTHGVIGTAQPDALTKDTWWDCADCHGKCMQQFGEGGGQKLIEKGTPDKTVPVKWLDGVLLVTVDQKWGWKVPGNPVLWHGYDWVACKRTAKNGSKCFTIPQVGDALITHRGYGRMEGYADALKKLRILARTADERQDYPNIKDHLETLYKLAQGNVLELGCREGVSTCSLLQGVEEKGGFVWSVDIDAASKTVWEGHPQWKFILADSVDVKTLTEAGVPDQIDMLFIDTDHTYERASKELATWGPRVKPTGVIVMHDTQEFPGVKQAAIEYAKAKNLSTEFTPICNGLGVLRAAINPETGTDSLPPLRSNLTTEDISYVIPVAKASPLLDACLKSIKQWSPKSEIIITANGCEIPPEIAKQANKVVTLELNTRYGAGCNRGAMEATRELVCLLNDDAAFIDYTPAKLVDAINSRGGIVAPYSNRAKWPQGDLERNLVPADSKYPDMVVGICMLLSTKLFHALGGFDTRFDTYEDDDICCRARTRFGVRCEVVGGTFIQHERHATFRAIGDDVQEIMRVNGQKFSKKHPKIKVIAIAKNEEKALKGFFDQFRTVTEDFNVLDTGSTDKTIEVAKSCGAKVESSPFENFSQARNEALKRFSRDADYVIMLDPDERLDEHTIRYMKEMLFSGTTYDIYLAPLQAVYPDKSRRAFVPKPFLFRNLPGIRWMFKVHEKLIGGTVAIVKNAMIEHILSYHEDGRRGQASSAYDGLAKQEPYFVDPEFKKIVIEQWPILDYDRMDDARIQKITIGPLISVVIPTHKRLVLLQNAVASARKQDYACKEIIVVGDNCPDLGPQKLEGTRTYNLPKNHGAGGAEPRNFGITVSAGDLISYLDDDNEWTADHLSSIYEEMRRESADLGFSSMLVNSIDLKFTAPIRGEIDTSCVVHKKDLIYKHGWWKERKDFGVYHSKDCPNALP
jgi:glycosyltransferase involved in cell wall biosynthesis/predicted O-methyltransferase YrrM